MMPKASPKAINSDTVMKGWLQGILNQDKMPYQEDIVTITRFHLQHDKQIIICHCHQYCQLQLIYLGWAETCMDCFHI